MTIVISPIGDLGFDDTFLARVGAEIQNTFGFPCHVLSLLEEEDLVADPSRGQVHSTPILERLAALLPNQWTKILGITRMDLFIPVLTHVYGEAQLGGKACIISTYRLGEGLYPNTNPETYRCRIVKEAIHELGHTFNLRHCPDQTCIMHYCRTIRDVDRKLNRLCRYCKILLEDEIKRQHNR
ncbi:MAG: archaemetzincin [Deltaproteobacteria bacterium]